MTGARKDPEIVRALKYYADSCRECRAESTEQDDICEDARRDVLAAIDNYAELEMLDAVCRSHGVTIITPKDPNA
jgi:hypothetical protein